MVWLRDHGCLVNLSDQRGVLELQDIANLLQLSLIFVQLMSNELVSIDNVLLNGIHLSQFEFERKLFQLLEGKHLDEFEIGS
jgi:hypothetical protein